MSPTPRVATVQRCADSLLQAALALGQHLIRELEEVRVKVHLRMERASTILFDGQIDHDLEAAARQQRRRIHKNSDSPENHGSCGRDWHLTPAHHWVSAVPNPSRAAAPMSCRSPLTRTVSSSLSMCAAAR